MHVSGGGGEEKGEEETGEEEKGEEEKVLLRISSKWPQSKV